MIGKLVRHIELDAIGLVTDHFVWSEWEGGYKVKFLKTVDTTGKAGYPSGMKNIQSAASNFEEVIYESR